MSKTPDSKESNTESPQFELKCNELLNGNESIGDILARFELVHLNDLKQDEAEIERNKAIEFPKIETEEYYFEMLFWGLRKIKLNKSSITNEKLFVQIIIGNNEIDENENVYSANLSEG